MPHPINITLSGYFALLLMVMGCNSNNSNGYISTISNLPSFKIVSIDSNQCINSDSIMIKQPLIFIYFSSDCEHCMRETKDLIKHKELLKHTKIYMITNDSSEDLKIFYSKFPPGSFRDIFIGRDYKYTFYKAYQPATTPYMAIYNHKRKLKKIYKGEVTIHSIVNSTRN